MSIWEEVKVEPVRIRIRTAVKSGFQQRTLYCVVESGNYNLGEALYVDGDEHKSCRVYEMERNEMQIDSAEKGMQVVLTVYGIQVKNLKNAEYLTAPGTISGSVEVEDYFTRLINNHFKEYTIKRNVRVTFMLPAALASYVLFRDNKPVLAIILCSSRIYNAKKIVNTMNACEELGIPVQRYFTEFENDKDYVINRIKSAL